MQNESEKFEELEFEVPMYIKEFILEQCEETGLSLDEYISFVIRSEMNREPTEDKEDDFLI